ncbi:E2F transcription factor E2FE [Trifolium repens]|nr:E2F transcription factor E2FE [Trifolium repens]
MCWKWCASDRREKSLALLTQNFVKLFVCSNLEMISLDDAARLLLGDAYNSSTIRTKVRRLYDIANVLTSMNLIKKTHTTNTRKPAFRWLGLKGKTWNEASLYNQNKMSLGKGHLEMILQTLALCGTEQICSWDMSTEIKCECLDSLCDVLHKFGNLMAAYHELLLSSLLSKLNSNQATVRHEHSILVNTVLEMVSIRYFPPCSGYSASPSSEKTWTMRSTFPEYGVALATIVGSVLFSIFGGVGIACLPLVLIFPFIWRPEAVTLAHSISRKQLNLVKKQKN